MKIWKEILICFFIGIGFGATIYLLILGVIYENIGDLRVPLKSVFIVFLCSGLIGELSFLFDTELSYFLAMVLHLIGTFSLFSIMMLLNNWPINIWTLLIFIFSYVVIWIIIKVTQEKDIRRINQQIKKRNG
ncbi:DUF3021 domain-containing protein [Lactobacillus taiwanensis]|uniref:DUF3021 domain-containing protein n=1 Tax=Lactobacillus taiwanensis TaxID=508451 RepID=UPI00214CAAD7|nr:DUF3021 domain-containing protein [Lactobacillus taiwanensis]MCR1903277.1 DUF3021 domain-containing protein [Lactobacillus taiwanensis]